jgi:multicomponent Na+:H+ antiporter subunit E
LFRGAGFFVFWLMLAGRDPTDFAVGAVTAGLAAWTSLYLLPPSTGRLRPLAILGFAMHFLDQSVRAGFDVALRAFTPSLPLKPGFVRYRSGIASAQARATFFGISSLMPGTLPCGSDPDGVLVVHGLDVAQPIASDLAAEEKRFDRMLSDG